MSLTARQLNRATLGRQMLLRRESLDVVDGVRRVVALQAQEPASPYIALWNRLVDFDPADLDAAFADAPGGQGVADTTHVACRGRAGLPGLPQRDAELPPVLAPEPTAATRRAACQPPTPTRSSRIS